VVLVTRDKILCSGTLTRSEQVLYRVTVTRPPCSNVIGRDGEDTVL